MNKEEILSIIQQILIDQNPPLTKEMITSEASLTHDLSLDENDVLEFNLECEVRFDIKLPFEKTKLDDGEKDLTIINNVVDYVFEHKS